MTNILWNQTVNYCSLYKNCIIFFEFYLSWKYHGKCLGSLDSRYVLKLLSETKLSAQANVITTLCNGYKNISNAIKTIKINTETLSDTKNVITHGLIKKMLNYRKILFFLKYGVKFCHKLMKETKIDRKKTSLGILTLV